MAGARDRFEIRYANGKTDLATSLEDAEWKIVHEASDGRVHGLLPATILTHRTEIIGTGEMVKTITADDVEAAISPATLMHKAVANITRRQTSGR